MATYGEVTRRIESELRADRSFDATTLNDAVYDSMRDIAKRCIPLSLVTKDINDDLMRRIDDMNFVRFPFKPTGSDNEKIDIDDLLSDAVVYGACKRLSRDRKGDYEALMRSAVNEYQWSVFESVQEDCDVL